MHFEVINDALLEKYLQHSLPSKEHRQLRIHLDKCRACWSRWNIYRWNKAKNSRGYFELKEFLGADFQEYIDCSWALANEWKRRKPKTQEEIESFYKQVPYYLYNLLIWKESGNRPPYVDYALPLLEKYNPRIILDFGCGIGNDGLEFLERGYNVIFCDFDNLSTQFLRWRLRKRKLSAKFVEPQAINNLRNFDTLWAMDVIEHLPNPVNYLSPLLETARIFIYDTDHAGKSSGRQPFHIEHSPKMLHQLIKSYGYRRDTSETHIKCWHK